MWYLIAMTRKDKIFSDGEHLVDYANMAKDILGLADDRMMSVPEIASKAEAQRGK